MYGYWTTAKLWDMEDWRKSCKERTRWTISKALPVGIDVLARYYFSVNLCASYSSCCCIILASSTSLIIICSFSYILCASSFSSHCSAKASRASLGELIYHLFGTDFLWSIFDRQFRKVALLVLQQCSEDCVVIGGKSKLFDDIWPYMGIFAVWGDIRLCHWP